MAHESLLPFDFKDLSVLRTGEVPKNSGLYDVVFSADLEDSRISSLKLDGVLIVSIDNPLGLSYWSGLTKTGGRLFETLCGNALPTPKEAREELKRKGFEFIEEFYPFPNYARPKTLFSRRLTEKDPSLSAELATLSPFENPGEERWLLFPESLAMETVARAGLFSEFSNSVLFVASRSSERIWSKVLSPLLQDREIAWHFSTSRKIPCVTKFIEQGNGIEVRKEKFGNFHEDTSPFQWIPTTEKLKRGRSLRTVMIQNAYADDFLACDLLMRDYLRNSLMEFGSENGVRPEALDATFLNARQIEPGKYEWFDLEWRNSEPVAKSWFVFRNVLSIFHARVNEFGFPHSSLAEYYLLLCRHFGIQADLSGDLLRETKFQTAVNRDHNAEEELERLSEAFHRKQEPRPFPRSARTEIQRRTAPPPKRSLFSFLFLRPRHEGIQ